MDKMYRVEVSGFLSEEVAEFFADQVRKGAPESLTIEVTDYWPAPEDDQDD